MFPIEMKKMHLPLPDDLHVRLQAEAERDGRPSTELAREAVAEFLTRRERQRFADELRAFAEEYGGTELDLDEDFERAATEHMARLPE